MMVHILLREIQLAWIYFYKPKTTSLLKIIPRAAMFGLALSLVILIATLSVMNGFERDIRDKLLSRTPHLTALGTQQIDVKSIAELEPLLRKTENFYHTKMLLPDDQYLQVNVIFSDTIEQPTVSSALVKTIGPIKPIKLMCFSRKKALWQPIPMIVSITPVFVIDDQQLDIFLPLSDKDLFKGLIMQPMQGFWLDNPLLVDQAESLLKNQYPKVSFISWKQTYSSLFEALQSEKRLIFIVLSLLIVLIYVQLALTLLLIFKEKEKDTITLYFFLKARSSIYRVFLSYGLLNVIFGTMLGCFGGYAFAHFLPDIIVCFERIFHCTVLPYEQYYSKHLPSEVRLDDVIFIGIVTLLAGIIACHFIVKNILSKKIDQLLRDHQ
jgi:lipoprotein-releasing system permease protein